MNNRDYDFGHEVQAKAWKTMEKRECKKCGEPMDCWTYVRTEAEHGEKVHTEKWICSFNPNHTS